MLRLQTWLVVSASFLSTALGSALPPDGKITTLGTALGSALPPDGKIVGGIDANIEDYPYQVSFQYGGSHICGASIISQSWALTAAHCCGFNIADLTLKAGSTFWEAGTTHKISKKIIHWLYNKSKTDYDLCLLKVEKKFVFGSTVAKIALPKWGEAIADGSSSAITGWGYTSEGGSVSSVLQVAWVPTVSTASCQTAYGASAITARMVCAGYAAGGKDTCQGDSGGPMVFGKKLIGVTSWGYGCARPDFPGVYARVANMRPWIKIFSGV